MVYAQGSVGSRMLWVLSPWEWERQTNFGQVWGGLLKNGKDWLPIGDAPGPGIWAFLCFFACGLSSSPWPGFLLFLRRRLRPTQAAVAGLRPEARRLCSKPTCSFLPLVLRT